MLETYEHDGKTVYRLRTINDLALLPEHCVEDAIAGLTLHIRSLRLVLAGATEMARQEGHVFNSGVALDTLVEPYLDYVDDGEIATAYHDPETGKALMRVSHKQETALG